MSSRKVQTKRGRVVKQIRRGSVRVGKRNFDNATVAARFLLGSYYARERLTQTNIANMLGVTVQLVNDEAKKMGLVDMHA